MVYFLTSSHCVAGSPKLNPVNGLVDELKKILPQPCRGLFVSSAPDDANWTDFVAQSTLESFESVGFSITFETLDRRTMEQAPTLVKRADLVFLSGGHVPTENKFLNQIHLRELLLGYHGAVMGVSAGSMNCADIVYAQPELPGEATSETYRRFLPGLGLTKTMMLPHYQMVKDNMLDDMRLYEDITCSDSMGHCFYALVDGSYIFGYAGIEELRGEAYRIQNGRIQKISDVGDIIFLQN